MVALTSSSTSVKDLATKAGLNALGGMRLSVQRGRHAGATHIAANKVITLGAGLDNDVVLYADQLAERHARITLLNPWSRTVRVEARDEAIMLANGRMIDVGHHADQALPLKFKAGGAECQIDTLRDQSALKRFVVPAIALLVALMVLPSIFGGISRLFSGGTPPRPPSVTTNSGSFSMDAAGSARWFDQMSEKIRTSGLTGQVSIERGASGNLVAVGMIEDGSVEKWRDVVKWYDALGGGPLLVNNVTRSGAQTQLPTFRSIWLDANPQVVLPNGQTAGPGETIPGGWKIEAIDAAGVLLTRDGRSARVSY